MLYDIVLSKGKIKGNHLVLLYGSVSEDEGIVVDTSKTNEYIKVDYVT